MYFEDDDAYRALLGNKILAWAEGGVVARKKTDAPRAFYLVCRDPATVAYHEPKNAIETEAAARARAASLAKETGHRFYVMRAIASCEPSAPPVEWTPLG